MDDDVIGTQNKNKLRSAEVWNMRNVIFANWFVMCE